MRHHRYAHRAIKTVPVRPVNVRRMLKYLIRSWGAEVLYSQGFQQRYIFGVDPYRIDRAPGRLVAHFAIDEDGRVTQNVRPELGT